VVASALQSVTMFILSFIISSFEIRLKTIPNLPDNIDKAGIYSWKLFEICVLLKF
jgi:hypothetical protein